MYKVQNIQNIQNPDTTSSSISCTKHTTIRKIYDKLIMKTKHYVTNAERKQHKLVAVELNYTTILRLEMHHIQIHMVNPSVML